MLPVICCLPLTLIAVLVLICLRAGNSRVHTSARVCHAYTLLYISLFIPAFATAQVHENTTAKNRWSVRSDFEINKADVRGTEVLDTVCERVDSVFKADGLRHVSITGFASPDGPMAFNARLATDRAQAIKKYLDQWLKLPTDIISVHDSGENWDGLRRMVTDDMNVPRRMEVLSVIDRHFYTEEGERLLRRMKEPWAYLVKNILPQLRYTEIVVDEERIIPADTIPGPVPEPEPTPVVIPEPGPEPERAPEVENEQAGCARYWHLRTSVPGLAAGVANIAAEYDFACHWSVALDVRYSAWNYFKQTRKFRTFQLRPEVRYWFGDDHRGLFVDAHLAMIAYNVALPSWKYRIQDRDGKHPALGGGLGVGYRLNLSRNGRWQIEGNVGLGVYHLDYNRYYNLDPTKRGQLFDS